MRSNATQVLDPKRVALPAAKIFHKQMMIYDLIKLLSMWQTTSIVGNWSDQKINKKKVKVKRKKQMKNVCNEELVSWKIMVLSHKRLIFIMIPV